MPAAPAADRYAAPAHATAARAPPRGETIEVQQGDTLYGIAKRYGVSIAALIEVNGLTNGASHQAGPAAGAAGRRAAAKHRAARPAARSRAPLAQARRPAHAAGPPHRIATAGWEGRHT